MGAELLQGDCLELMRGVPAGSVDCVIADLPFGSTCNGWDKTISTPPMGKSDKSMQRQCRNAVFLSNAICRRIGTE